MITKGFGTGNCFYDGVLGTGAAGKHKFRCTKVGALKKSDKLQLAFQFRIGNVGKSMDISASATAHVTNKALTLKCKMQIFTYATASTSTVKWYESEYTTKVDGSG